MCTVHTALLDETMSKPQAQYIIYLEVQVPNNSTKAIKNRLNLVY